MKGSHCTKTKLEAWICRVFNGPFKHSLIFVNEYGNLPDWSLITNELHYEISDGISWTKEIEFSRLVFLQ